jgi:hypothetical protein
VLTYPSIPTIRTVGWRLAPAVLLGLLLTGAWLGFGLGTQKDGSVRSGVYAFSVMMWIPSGMLVKTLWHGFGTTYRITSQTYFGLAGLQFPDELAKKLKPIQDRDFVGAVSFLAALREALGDVHAAKWKGEILKNSNTEAYHDE